MRTLPRTTQFGEHKFLRSLQPVVRGGELLAPSCPPGASPWAVGAESLAGGLHNFLPNDVDADTASVPQQSSSPCQPRQERWRGLLLKREERELRCRNPSRRLH